MAFTTKLLVVANQTVGSPELREELLRRAAAGPLQVTLVAPAPRDSGTTADAHREAAKRLRRAVKRLRAEGLTVEGALGDPDPLIAVDDVWDPRRFDEVIVTTLPEATSRWLTLNLPNRVARHTGAQVSHIIGRGGAEPQLTS